MMDYKSRFTGWSEVKLEDLILAYRKAKADCFFENTFPFAVKFAEYEQDLIENLSSLSERIQSGAVLKDERLLGELRLVPKKLSVVPKPDSTQGHVHFSSPERAVRDFLDKNDITPEFRIIGDFPVDAHILSALWINTVGHKFDASFEDSSYGARLRRIRNDELHEDPKDYPFHIRAIGSFEPYYNRYQKWRSDGLNAIRDELDKDRDVIAVSLDLKNYYHNIDTRVYCHQEFIDSFDLGLSAAETSFTVELAHFLMAWSTKCSFFSSERLESDKANGGGLVIGLTASRILSNALLNRWDKLVKEKLAPIHYGRYVDDMFFVLRDTETISSINDFLDYLAKQLDGIVKSPRNSRSGDWQIDLGEGMQASSRLLLQPDKQKLFLLSGSAGKDLLNSIVLEIDKLSSERRLMPSPDELDQTTAAKVLSAADGVSESADALRKADGLSIKRLSWSLQLRHVETIANDLPPKQWGKQRKDFFQFAHDHVLRADQLFKHINYLPRLLGFAIHIGEWVEAQRILDKVEISIRDLSDKTPKGSKVLINGSELNSGARLWDFVWASITLQFIDSATRYRDPEKLFDGEHAKSKKQIADKFFEGLWGSLHKLEDLLAANLDVVEFHKKAPIVARADLAKTPYKKILRMSVAKHLVSTSKNKDWQLMELAEEAGLLEAAYFSEFLKASKNFRFGHIGDKSKLRGFEERLLPYIFPTRPLTPEEISEAVPQCVGLELKKRSDGLTPAKLWARYTQSIRGVWVKPTLLANVEEKEAEESKDRNRVHLNIGLESKKTVKIALTNVLTTDEDYAKSAANKPNLTMSRYKRLSDLVNQTLSLENKPDYLVLPELSLPLAWVESIARPLLSCGVSLIAGTEYRHYPKNEVLSEACLVLQDNRLGYTSSVKIWQKKLEPAVKEDQNLHATYGKAWAKSKLPKKKTKPVYIHNGFHFGVFVCSEVTNSKSRQALQGHVDALMVLAWNRDLDTFSSLVESAALDVHAYTILVNNRQYGDSRVRAPAKDSFRKDIARIRGGENDFVVVAEIDVESLRAFQSRAKRWPKSQDQFKAVPEGFKLNPKRKTIPKK